MQEDIGAVREALTVCAAVIIDLVQKGINHVTALTANDCHLSVWTLTALCFGASRGARTLKAYSQIFSLVTSCNLDMITSQPGS